MVRAVWSSASNGHAQELSPVSLHARLLSGSSVSKIYAAAREACTLHPERHLLVRRHGLWRGHKSCGLQPCASPPCTLPRAPQLIQQTTTLLEDPPTDGQNTRWQRCCTHARTCIPAPIDHCLHVSRHAAYDVVRLTWCACPE